MNYLLKCVVRVLDQFYASIAVLAGTAILAAIALTFADVSLRMAGRITAALGSGVRPSWAVPGLIDLTQLAILTAAALSIAVAFWRETHVGVDIMTGLLQPRYQRLFASFGGFLGAGLMIACFWCGLGELQAQYSFPSSSAALGISYFWYWLPLLAGLSLAAFAVFTRTTILVVQTLLDTGNHIHV